MENRTSLKLKPEAIKPGLNVMVNWDYRLGGNVFYPGVVVRKLRKNWLVKLDRGMGYQNTSVPYETMTVDIAYTKNGRVLMAGNKEDVKYGDSEKHKNDMLSLVIVPENTTINHAEIN